MNLSILKNKFIKNAGRYGGASIILLMGIFSLPHPGIAGQSPEKIKVVNTVPAYGQKIESLNDLVITIHFNRNVDPTIQDDFVLDQRGVSDPEGNSIEIKGHISWPDPKTLQFKADEPLKPSATYQANLFSVRTPEGEEMEEAPYRLVFTTAERKVK